MCRGRHRLVLSTWIDINSVFVSEHRNRLGIRVGIEINLISVAECKLPCLCVRDRNLPGFSVGIEIELFFVRRFKLTSFLVYGPIYFSFHVLIEIDFTGGLDPLPGQCGLQKHVVETLNDVGHH